MTNKPAYEELEQRVKALEKETYKLKLTEQELRKNEKRLRAFLNNLGDIAYETDSSGNVTYANKMGEIVTGVPLKDIIDKPFLSLFTKESQKVALNVYQETLYGGSPEYELTFINGRICHFKNEPLRNKDGVIIGVFGIARDITERKRAEKALRKSHDELEQRVQERTFELTVANEQLKSKIEKHEQTEEALRESEDRFKAIFETAQDSIFIKDRNLEYILVNPSMEHLFGLPASKLIGKTDEELFGEEAGAHIREIDLRILNGKIIEDEHTKPIGEKPITFHVVKVPVRDNCGKVEGLCGIARDITERKRAEESLRDSEKNYHNLYKLMRLITDNVPDLIWAKDMDDRFIFVNQAICDKLLMCDRPDKAVGKTDIFFAEQERNAGYKHTFGEICVNSDAITKERKAPGRFLEEGFVRNKYLVLDVHKAPFLNGGGEMIGTVGCGRDITKEKEIEEALRESEEKYKTLAENSLTGVFIHQDGRYVFVNDRFAQIHGYTSEELPGETYLTLIHPDEAETVAQRVSKRLKKKPVVRRYEVRRLRKDGKTIWCEMMATRIEYQGRPAVMGNIIDITERKQAEEALKLSNEKLLKEYNQRKILSKRLIDLREKDRHEIAMELHDHIGQLLTSLKINIEMIDDKLKPIDTELGFLIQAAEKKAIQAIKDIKNISHGLMPEILDSLGLVSSLRALFNEVREHTDIKIKFFNRNVPKRFDREKELAIYRIAQEALTNVLKHSRAKNAHVNLVKKDKVFSLSVEDDGIGFDQDVVMKISKRKGPLGLVIMRERAIQLHGELTIESQMGKGTHLLVEIPL